MSISAFDPTVLDFLHKMCISVVDNLEHDVDAFLVEEHLLLYHNAKEMILEYEETALDMRAEVILE
jgi:hypothetical protein